MRWTQPAHLMMKLDQAIRVQGIKAVPSRAELSSSPDPAGITAQTRRGRPSIGVVLLLFLFAGVWLWTRWDFTGQTIPDWKPVLALADTALERGDLHYAKSLYLQAGRLSVSRDDWAGLLAAACGMKKLERQKGRHSETTALLLSAMVAAKRRQSRSGLVAVAKAFSALGQDKVASMVLSHTGKDWVEETISSPDVIPPGCWQRQG